MKHSPRSIAILGHGHGVKGATAALLSPDAAVRRIALGAAWRLDALDSERLGTFFADPDEGVARRALELAARLDHESPDRRSMALRIVALLDGPLAEVAAFALGELEIAEDEVVEGLAAQAATNHDPLARESAVAALGALGRAPHVVLEALTDVATVRRRAVIALANFDGPEVDAALEKALEDRDWQVRQVAEDLLQPPPDE